MTPLSVVLSADGRPLGPGRDIRIGPLCAHVGAGRFWLRLWERGPGLHVKDADRHPLLFSQRGRGVRFGRWWVGRVKWERSGRGTRRRTKRSGLPERR